VTHDAGHNPEAYEVTEGPAPAAEPDADENTQRRLERMLEESFIDRRANQQRRSGNK
jgi:hypothetical protein